MVDLPPKMQSEVRSTDLGLHFGGNVLERHHQEGDFPKKNAFALKHFLVGSSTITKKDNFLRENFYDF